MGISPKPNAVARIILVLPGLLVCMAAAWVLPPRGITAVFLLVSGLECAAVFWYLPVWMASCRLWKAGGRFIYRRGVLFRRITVLQQTSLAYAEQVSTPIERKMGLVHLRLKAARGSVFVPFLPQEQAAQLLEEWKK